MSLESTSAAQQRRPEDSARRARLTSRWPALPAAAWSLCLAPATILLHELGHFWAAHLVGYPSPVLHFSGVDPGPSADVPLAASGLVALTGPIVSAMLALLGCAWLRGPGRAVWAAALAVTAVSRFAVGVPYTLVNLWVRVQGRQLMPPAFDEYKAGTALGWSGDALLGVTTLLCALVLWWVGRHLRDGARTAGWVGLLGGTALGWALWMQIVGPWWLP